MRSIKAYLLFTVAAFAIVSCQKEPDEDILTPPNANCQITKAEILDGGSVEDTAGYVYTNDKVTRLNLTDYYNTFEYNGDKVTKRSYFDAGTSTLVAFDNVTYNGDGTVAKVETFYASPLAPAGLLIFSYEFVYNSGKLTRFLEKVDTTFSGTTPVSMYEYDYTYTGNNITRVIENDIEGAYKDTFDLSYDNKANNFRKNPASLFTDMFFVQLNGQNLPLYISANNAIKLDDDGDEFLISYSVDDKGNLKEVLVDGEAIVRYYHKCN